MLQTFKRPAFSKDDAQRLACAAQGDERGFDQQIALTGIVCQT
jgi:hypothetical protein